MTHRRVVAVLYAVCGVYAVLSLLESLGERRMGGLILVLFCSMTWLGIRRLDYFEFSAAARTLFGGGLRRLMTNQLLLDALDQALDSAPDEPSCWEALRDTLDEGGFAGLHARFNGQEFHQPDRGDAPYWQLRIPLPGGDYVNLERHFNVPSPPVLVGPLAELLHRRLSCRLADMAARRSAETRSLASLAQSVDSFEAAGEPAHAGASSREPRTFS
jgi:hypothetical protein